MKTKLFILSLFALAMFACNDSNSEKQEPKNDIVGTWKLVENYGSDGAHGQWYPVENGYTYTFTEDGKLISNIYSCNGVYQIDSDKVTIKFECSEDQYYEICKFYFEDGMLILAPMNCFEGCMQKYCV